MPTTTPKLDRIIDQFTALMGYPAVYSTFTLQNSDVLTKFQVEAYISKAMFKIFNQYWTMATQRAKTIKDAAQQFLFVLPELERSPDITFNGSGEYTIVNPDLDFFYPYAASDSNKFHARILDATFLQIVRSEIYPQYTATTAKPIIIYSSGKLKLFPAAAVTYEVSFIKTPIIPTTGDPLEQNKVSNAEDSPFSVQWEPIIADMADKIYRQERQLGD